MTSQTLRKRGLEIDRCAQEGLGHIEKADHGGVGGCLFLVKIRNRLIRRSRLREFGESVAPTDSPQTIALSSRGHSPAPSARYSQRGSRKDGSIRFTPKCCKSDTGALGAHLSYALSIGCSLFFGLPAINSAYGLSLCAATRHQGSLPRRSRFQTHQF